MKIVFEGSELKEGTIKVSLDGGFTFADYEIADVKESGIPLDDSQRYDKIKIKGPANVLKSLDIVSNVKVQGEQTSESSDYEVKYYAWQQANGRILYTKVCSDSNSVIVYQYDGRDGYYEFIGKAMHFELHGNELRWVDELAESSEDVTNYIVYNRYQEGDVKEQKSLPITPIYYQLYDGGCGYGFRLKEAGCGYSPNYTFNPKVLYVKINGSYTSLRNLCEYDGHFNAMSYTNTNNFTGDLYVHADIPGSCPYESYYIRVPFRLEEWK